MQLEKPVATPSTTASLKTAWQEKHIPIFDSVRTLCNGKSTRYNLHNHSTAAYLFILPYAQFAITTNS
jgi:hypothetical protein